LDNLLIVFKMKTPIVESYKRYPFPLHLDALLIRLLADEHGTIFNPAIPEDKSPFSPKNPANIVPLAVVGKKSPVFKASAWLTVEEKVDEEQFIKKYAPPGIISSNPNKGVRYNPNEASGKNRVWNEKIKIIATPFIFFECEGDREEITRILKKPFRIGKMRRVGFGEVESVVVFSSNNPHAGIYLADGSPARILPVEEFDPPNKENSSIISAVPRPPYWNLLDKELCWEPRRLVSPENFNLGFTGSEI